MPLSLRVTPPQIEVPFTFGYDLIPQGLKLAQDIGEQCIITTESLLPHLPPLLDPIVLPNKETIKNRAMKEWIEEILYERGANKSTVFVAIGGGALLDLVGFVAATFMRGAPLISFPTTLLAMTDASIGGKNGVNLKKAKNWIGTYHHPAHIFFDFHFLESLPQNTWIDGLAETIKHAIIWDEMLFSFLEENHTSIINRNPHIIKEMIEKSVAVKCAIVTKDPFEFKGLRHILNFGHTVGHALEAHFNYALSHGEAVAMGMIVEAAISVELGLLNRGDYERIFQLITSFPFKFPFPDHLSYALLQRDKKEGRMIAITSLGGECCMVNLTQKLFIQGWTDALLHIKEGLSPCTH
ncbi:MAG: 3-dehydroquinate synthase [Chlamydiales bacterium]|nr:3-dehydroquinate synthase [Chlamydiales bacterium]MCH9619991.1 3-dehydroquinate synthase [Chlamydiales bacterium]MCH9622905.1 3-dehydroquinate synthase [Chlamydiales bacterium]